MPEPITSLNSLRLGITKRYGNKTVLDNLELEIRGGEFVRFSDRADAVSRPRCRSSPG